ncbi:MAG: membrane protein insertase YidC [Deltaproteobacteria bacterium]|nr:membrane protein insertase YidC [Deltaproteobacteria bacterium]
MDSNAARTLLAIGLCMAVLFLWQFMFAPKPAPRPLAPDAAVAAGVRDGGAGPGHAAATRDEDAGAAPAQAERPEEEKAPRARPEEKLYAFETGLWQAVFTDRGGALKSFRLKKYRVATKDPRPVDLVTAPAGDDLLPLAASFSKANFAFDPADTFEVAAQTAESITFSRTGGGVTVERAYTFKKDEYVFGLGTTVRNDGSAKITGKPVIAWAEQAPKTARSSSLFFSSGPENVHVPSCLVNDSVEKLESPSEKAPSPRAFFEGRVMWAGADSRYFLAAIVPQTGGRTGCEIRTDTSGVFSASVMQPEFEIPPGESRSFSYRVFVGPKDYGTLKAMQSGLDRSVDYGWLSVLCVPMLWLLRIFFSVVGNYGVAIIGLTILVKLASLPLTEKSYKAMQEMARLKPLIDEIQKKHKDDRQKVNEEMMRLYQQHGISPLSGCLPMLLQMPIWIALYRMLFSAVELYQAPFIRGWTDNLAEKDPTYVLPVLLGVGMFIQQKITPTTMDSTQAKVMLYFMPAFFTLIMLSLPSGLTLYIFVNTILSLGHQVYNNRRAGAPPRAPARAA